MNKPLLQAGAWLAITGASLLVSTGSAVAAKVDRYDGQWHYSLTPYAWFPNIESDGSSIRTPGGAARASKWRSSQTATSATSNSA
jgi:hypothetical protein